MMNPTTHNAIIAEAMSKSIENGTAPWIKEHEAGEVTLPFNPSNGKLYTEQNAVYLMAVAAEKNYTDPRWCSFNQAKEEKWTIKDNEKAIPVKYYAPDENNKMAVKYFFVFNASQMDGLPPVENARQQVGIQKPDLKKMMDNLGVKHEEHNFDYHTYDFKIDTIKVSRYSTERDNDLYSKIVQAAGHKDRDNRNYYNDFDKPQAKELESATISLASFLHAAKHQLSYSPKQINYEQIKAVLPVALENAVSANRFIEKGGREKSLEQAPQKVREKESELER